MSRGRMRMRRIREILRYHFKGKLSNERIGLALAISKGSVYNTLQRFHSTGLTWPLSPELSDQALEDRLYPQSGQCTPLPDLAYLEKELSRRHVTLQLLWEEYHDSNPDGLSRSSFYRYFQKDRPTKPCMKLTHKGGDKLFVDYSGDSLTYIDRETGEPVKTELFVASWGASSYTYAEVTHTQRSEDFVGSHVHAFNYFGVVPHAVVPDNLKSGVKKAHRYDPEINPLYAQMVKHYGTVVLPARVGKPQDKAVVESNILVAQRFILGHLRDEIFYSLAEINAAIWPLLDELNSRGMKDYGGQTRKERFIEHDLPNAKPLRAEPFTITGIRCGVRVAPNYHIRYKEHYYSVPHHLARKSVDVYQNGNVIEIYHDNVHVCRHQFSLKKYRYTTRDEHMPSEHRYVKGWSSRWFIFKAGEIGPHCATVIQAVMKKQEHVQQGFNAAMGILRLAKVYSEQRLEAACTRACKYKSYSIRALKSILEKNLDKADEPTAVYQTELPVITHENIRGAAYYQN